MTNVVQRKTFMTGSLTFDRRKDFKTQSLDAISDLFRHASNYFALHAADKDIEIPVKFSISQVTERFDISYVLELEYSEKESTP